MRSSVLVIGAALLVWSSGAVAQNTGMSPDEMVATRLCSSDISARCSVEMGGSDRIRACVKEHFKDMSKPCQERLARLAAISQACTADIKQFCADVKRGHSRVEACLQSKLGSLSDGCKDALAKTVASKW
jgi:hypothetical protein